MNETVEDWEGVYYADVPDLAHYVVGCFLALLLIIGLIGNALSILLFAMTKKLRTPQNMMLFNLSVIDLIMVLSCQPDFMIASFTRKPPAFGCNITGPLSTFGGIGSMIAITAIAYDRYVMICFPVESLTLAKSTRSLKMIAFVWIYSAIFAISPILGFGKFMLNGFKTSCCFDYITRNWNVTSFILVMYLFGFFLPLLVIIFCYFHIYTALKQRRITHLSRRIQELKECATTPVEDQDALLEYVGYCMSLSIENSLMGASDLARLARMQRREIQIWRLAMVVIGLFMVAWAPYAVVALIGQFIGPAYINPYMSTLPALFAKSNCVYNPFVYAVAHPNYRKEIGKRFDNLSKWFGYPPPPPTTVKDNDDILPEDDTCI